jgi:hypothetical protein
MSEWGNSLFGARATSQSTLDEMINSVSSTPDQDGDFLGYGVFRTTRISATDVFIGHDGNAPGYRSVMFYQPDRKMTIAILTNYRGARLYDVAKALYEALPPFICGNKNKKEDKIVLCLNRNNLCVDRNAAAGFIEKGAYLGGCDVEALTKAVSHILPTEQNHLLPDNALISVYPNPSSTHATIFFKTSQAGKVNLRLYDMQGKLIKNIYEGILEKGMLQKVEIETGKFPPGIYVTRLQTSDGVSEKKIVIKR